MCRIFLAPSAHATWGEGVVSVCRTEQEAKIELVRLLIKRKKKRSLRKKNIPNNKRYWRTPPDLYDALNEEFNFDFDPCPCPRPAHYDSLKVEWGHSNFINPPFRKKDGVDGQGPTAFARKAIAENVAGKTSVLILPVQSYVNLLLEAGAEIRPLGRVRWLDADTLEVSPNPTTVALFILRK